MEKRKLTDRVPRDMRCLAELQLQGRMRALAREAFTSNRADLPTTVELNEIASSAFSRARRARS
jgi:hypothetical protein